MARVSVGGLGFSLDCVGRRILRFVPSMMLKAYRVAVAWPQIEWAPKPLACVVCGVSQMIRIRLFYLADSTTRYPYDVSSTQAVRPNTV